ncbi:hypothetical protein AXE65_05135 [Ventosimonas gracilis]|uniref:Outer membrane protein assembly factor BamC n=1 Tax=Ventosimonas gracilis TaxID=1680762 RepID=A0A139SP99_9GAMM|nr:outer membrane protein assembly factor BamC [Ventosimonas gracilis]KXU36408.1 hypothetical protein AXE65_05135 [Ventosimonas gracilis]
MKPLAGCALLALLLASQGCGYLRDRSNDYQQATQSPPLQVPQGLDGQFRPLDPLLPIPEQVIDARLDPDYKVPRPQALPSVAPTEFSLQDSGASRWILALRPPAQVWPLALSYFDDTGFTLTSQNAQTGELITDWKALQPVSEFRVRVRIEPGVQRGSSEIFVVSVQRPSGSNANPPFPEHIKTDALDALLLNELLAGLTQAAAQGGAVSLLAAHFDSPGKVSLSDNALTLDTDFDRAWSSIGRALQSAGVTTFDRDRSQGLYYIDNRQTKGFWAKLWGEDEKDSPQHYQIRLNQTAAQVQVTVEQDGSPAPADTARRVLSLIQQNL